MTGARPLALYLAALAWAALAIAWAEPAGAHHGAPYTENVRDARAWARAHTTDEGWRCLDKLWHAESGWSVHARTPKSAPLTQAAYGIPQAFPGVRLKSAGEGWRHDGTTQARWGLRYVRGRYRSACAARAYQLRHGWY